MTPTRDRKRQSLRDAAEACKGGHVKVNDGVAPREVIEACVDGVAQLQSSAARPARLVGGEDLSEDLTAFGPEDRPCRRKVSGRVAVAGVAPVEDSGDVALFDEQVAWDQVVVNEARRGGVVQLVR